MKRQAYIPSTRPGAPPIAPLPLKPHQSERFVPYIMRIELGILQVAVADPALTDDDARQAIAHLVRALKRSGAGSAPFDAAAAEALGQAAAEATGQRIMVSLAVALEKEGPLPVEDVIGVLGVVKSSAGAWSQGPRSRAYLRYLQDFFADMGIVVTKSDAGTR